jgi:hypothetical protein
MDGAVDAAVELKLVMVLVPSVAVVPVPVVVVVVVVEKPGMVVAVVDDALEIVDLGERWSHGYFGVDGIVDAQDSKHAVYLYFDAAVVAHTLYLTVV